MRKLRCWWFGCLPDYRPSSYGFTEAVPCERCGAGDTSYSDRVGDTRHARFMDRLRSLFPSRKKVENDDDIPF